MDNPPLPGLVSFCLSVFHSSALSRVCSTCVSQHAPLPAHLPVCLFIYSVSQNIGFLFICSVWVPSHLCLPASYAACLSVCLSFHLSVLLNGCSICLPACHRSASVCCLLPLRLPACLISLYLLYLSVPPVFPSASFPSPVCLRVYCLPACPFPSICVSKDCVLYLSHLPPSTNPAPHPPTPASTHAVPNIRISGELPAEARLGTTSPGSLRGCGERGRRRGAGLDGRRLTAVRFEPSSLRAGAAQLGPSATRRSGRPRQCPGASHAEPRPRAVAAGDEREEPK